MNRHEQAVQLSAAQNIDYGEALVLVSSPDIHQRALQLSAEHNIDYGEATVMAGKQLVAVVYDGKIVGDDTDQATTPEPRRHPSGSRLDDLDPHAAETYVAEPHLLRPVSSIGEAERRMGVTTHAAAEIVGLDRRIAELEGPPRPEFPANPVIYLDYRHLPRDLMPIQSWNDDHWERDKRRYDAAELPAKRAHWALLADVGFDPVYEDWRERQQVAINALVHLRLNTIAQGQTDHALAQRRARESAEFEKQLEQRKREDREARRELVERSPGLHPYGL